jgi:hypothetical protein
LETVADAPDHSRFLCDYDDFTEALAVIRNAAADPVCAHTWAGEELSELV